MIATAIAAATGVVVSLVLVPRFGLIGAAIGMGTAIVTENTGTMVAVKWRLGFWPFNLAWLKPLAAGAIAAGGAVGGTAPPPPPRGADPQGEGLRGLPCRPLPRPPLPFRPLPPGQEVPR